MGEDLNPFLISQYLQIITPLLFIGVRHPIILLQIPLTNVPTEHAH